GYPFFVLLARTGVRVGELLALKWDDLSATSIRVDETLSRNRIGSPKGGRSRQVDIGNHPVLTAAHADLGQVPAILHRHETAEKAAALKRGIRSEFVFTTSGGKSLPESDVRRILKAALLCTGVARHHSPHSFRHTFATLLVAAGESIVFVQQQLGHSDIKLTVNTYGSHAPARSVLAAGQSSSVTVSPAAGSPAGNLLGVETAEPRKVANLVAVKA